MYIIIVNVVLACEFTDVVIISGKCIPPMDSEGTYKLMTFLKTPNKAELRTKYVQGLLSSDDMLMAALSEWRSRRSNDATLTALISCLRECSLNSYADALEKEYYPEAPSICSQKPTKSTPNNVIPGCSHHFQHTEKTNLLPMSPNHVKTESNIKRTSSKELFPKDRYTSIMKSLARLCSAVFVIALIFPAVTYLQGTFNESSIEMETSSEAISLQLGPQVKF